MDTIDLYHLYSSIEQGIKDIEKAENEFRYRDVVAILRGCMESFDKIVIELICTNAHLPSKEVWDGSIEIHWDKKNSGNDGWKYKSFIISNIESRIYYREKTNKCQDLSGIALRQRAHLIATPYTDELPYEEFNNFYRIFSDIGSHSTSSLPLKEYLEIVYQFKEKFIICFNSRLVSDIRDIIKQQERKCLDDNLEQYKRICEDLLNPTKEIISFYHKNFSTFTDTIKEIAESDKVIIYKFYSLIEDFTNNLVNLEKRLSRERSSFSICVTGAYLSGKTSFINILANDEVFLETDSINIDQQKSIIHLSGMNVFELQIQENFNQEELAALKESDIIIYLIKNNHLSKDDLCQLKKIRKINGNVIILFNGCSHDGLDPKIIEKEIGISSKMTFQIDLSYSKSTVEYSDHGFNALVHYLVTYVGDYAIKTRQQFVLDCYSELIKIFTSIEAILSTIEENKDSISSFSSDFEVNILKKLNETYNSKKQSLKKELLNLYPNKISTGNNIIRSFYRELIESVLSSVERPLNAVYFSITNPINKAPLIKPWNFLGGLAGALLVFPYGFVPILLAFTSNKLGKLLYKKQIDSLVDDKLNQDIMNQLKKNIIPKLQKEYNNICMDLEYILGLINEELDNLYSSLPSQMQNITFGLAKMTLREEGFDEQTIKNTIDYIIYIPEKYMIIYDSFYYNGKHLIINTLKNCYPQDVSIISVPNTMTIKKMKQLLIEKHVSKDDINTIMKLRNIIKKHCRQH